MLLYAWEISHAIEMISKSIISHASRETITRFDDPSLLIDHMSSSICMSFFFLFFAFCFLSLNADDGWTAVENINRSRL